MFNNFYKKAKRKAKKAGKAISNGASDFKNKIEDAVESKHNVLVDGKIVANNLLEEELFDFLKSEYEIEIQEVEK